MASSLRDLLTQEGFQHRKVHKHARPTTPKTPSAVPKQPLSARASVCSDRHSLDQVPLRTPQPNGSSCFSSTGSRSASQHLVEELPSLGDEELPVDTAAAHTVVLILSGYAGRFLKDAAFRMSLREKCAVCLAPARKGVAHAVLANLELGIESIERLAEEGSDATTMLRESKIRSLRNSIRLLSIVASLNAPRSQGGGGGGGYTCGIPNSHLSACAQLYLSIVYRIERNDSVSARHLLQVFVDAPYLARKKLLPDLWDHLFLPHLLHLEVWYNKEVELITGWDVEDQDQRMKGLNRAYNDQMDLGTAQFALYYKDWLKVGTRAPPVPSVPLPSRPNYVEPWGKRSVSLSRNSINKNLYQAVLGSSLEQEDITKGVWQIGDAKLASVRGFQVDDNKGSCKLRRFANNSMGLQEKELDPAGEIPIPKVTPTPRKSYSFRLFSCRSDSNRGMIHRPISSKEEFVAAAREQEGDESMSSLEQAVVLISSSKDLKKCEFAVRVVAKALLEPHGDSSVETALSLSSFIEGLLEVTLTSKDEEVLDLAICILAELIARNLVNRQIVLNADPQLEIFLRLLRSNNLFLKASIALYLIKPKAKQMLSSDWIHLVLRVLDCGDERQTLFTVKCTPKTAALYFLDQLLMGFDVDRSVENAKQMVALGGLDLLIRGLQMGDACEKENCLSLLTTCIQADGSCRHYLASNVMKESVVKLLLGNQLKSGGTALYLLSELVCLDRTTQIIKFLKELKNEDSLNTMHVLLVYLQQAPLVQRPLAAAILLQLDLLGDPLRYSVYREEAVDAIVMALEYNLHNKKVQEQCVRALFLLAGRFSCSGEATAEAWLLKRAGLDDSPADSFSIIEISRDKNAMAEEDKVAEERLRNLATVLLNSGGKRLFVALSNCISDAIPSLARACLITVAWMSTSLSSLHGSASLQPLVCSILAPRLLENLSYDRALEERVLASLSLLNFAKNSECVARLFPLDKETISSLQALAEVTWTAKELLFACCR